MKYYRVLKSAADKQILKKDRRGHLTMDRFLIANELYSPAEYNKMKTRSYNKIDTYFETVNIPKNKIYWFFGARFAGPINSPEGGTI